jgi:hypothetical protein
MYNAVVLGPDTKVDRNHARKGIRDMVENYSAETGTGEPWVFIVYQKYVFLAPSGGPHDSSVVVSFRDACINTCTAAAGRGPLQVSGHEANRSADRPPVPDGLLDWLFCPVSVPSFGMLLLLGFFMELLGVIGL